jgi:hypothetical protein
MSGPAATARVRGDVVADATPQQVWDVLVDWPRQREWMLGTNVRPVGPQHHGPGARLAAFTGAGPLGFTDEMVVVEWEPPVRCVVRHTGALVRGTGAFEVFALPHGRARLVWTEDVDLPWGRVGALGWPLVRPAVAAGVRASLRRFGRLVAG